MAIARNTRLLEDSEPLFRSTSRAAPPAVAAPVAAPIAPLAPQKFDPVALQAALANFKLPTAPATPVQATAPVTPAPIPLAPTPVGAPTTWSTAPIDLAKYGLTQKDVNDASLLAPYKAPTPGPAPVAPSAAASVAPPPVVTAAPAPAPAPVATATTAPAPATPPSYSDWLKTQPAPQRQTFGNPLALMQQNNQAQSAWNTSKAGEYLTQYGNQLRPEQLATFFKQSGWWPQIREETEGGAYYNDDININVGGFTVSKGAVRDTGKNYNSYTNSGDLAGYAFSKEGDPYVYSYDEQGKFLNKSKTDWLGNGWLTTTYDSQGKKLGENFQEKHQSGFGSFLKAVAPVALGVLAPGVGTAISGALSGALGTGLANTLATGAIIGGGTSALTGGNVLKGAALGGLGAGVSAGIGSLTQGMDPSIVKAAQGAGSTLVKGAVTGNIDPASILASGATGYLSTPITNAIKEYVPETGSTTLDNIIRNTAIQTPGTLIRGGDLGDILTNAAIGETVKTATGYIPKTDIDFVDRMIAGTAGQYLGKELRDVLGDTPSSRPPVVAQAPAPAPTTAPAPADSAAPPAQAPAIQPSSAQDNSGLMAMLLAAGLMGDEGQDQTQAPPQLFQAPTLATLPGQLPGQLGGQPTSLAELMALLNTRRA